MIITNKCLILISFFSFYQNQLIYLNKCLIFSNNFYSPNFTQTILIYHVNQGWLITAKQEFLPKNSCREIKYMEVIYFPIAKREFSKKISRRIQNYKDVILYPLALIAFFFDSSHPFSSPSFCSF